MDRWELIPAFDRREALRPLYAEYAAMLLEADPTFIRSLDQQNYDDEIARLEEKYAAPGRFYLLYADGAVAGCVGMRALDAAHAELKRLYVRPEFRGNGLGEKLTRRIMDDARAEGFSFLRLDTLPPLRAALALYRRLGFHEIPPYYDCLIPGTIFLEYDLKKAVIRDARPEDAARLAEIYGYYVEHTAITYEYAVPTAEEFRGRIEKTLRRYPYLVAEEAGVILGYAYAGPLITRPAADWVCEVSIYLDRGARKRGLGRALYAALEEALKRMGICSLYALVALPEVPDEYLDGNSAGFHAHLGFREAGRLHSCGHKFGRWYDLLYLEKQIAPHLPDMPPIRSYSGSKASEA